MGEPIGSAEALGVALARAREANGLSQREMATKLGVSKRYIVEMEAGKPSLYSERLFAFIALTGLELAATQPLPAERIGTAPILWARAAAVADASALRAIDARRSAEEFAALAADDERRLIVIDERIDWPRRRSVRLRAELGPGRLGALAGYGLDGEVFVAPGPHADEVRDALGLAFGHESGLAFGHEPGFGGDESAGATVTVRPGESAQAG